MKLIFAAGLLATALLASHVTPTLSSPIAESAAVAVAQPSKPLNLEVLLAVDLSGLGTRLNALLGLLTEVGKADKCQYSDYASKLTDLIIDLKVYINLLGINVKLNLEILLGPLLKAVLELVNGLLRGVLLDLKIIINLVVNILYTLHLKLDVEVAIKLGKLLDLDVIALVNVG